MIFKNLWLIGNLILIFLIVLTIVILLLAFFKKVKLKKPNKWFEEATEFNQQLQRLINHQDRILGTLNFWKNKAELYHRLNISKLYWSLISSILIPVLLQFYNSDNILSISFMTILPTWTAIIVALAQSLKADAKYRGYRQCESDYYDLARELLDNPMPDDEQLKKQVDEFIEVARQIRKIGRTVEIDSTITVMTSKKFTKINNK